MSVAQACFLAALCLVLLAIVGFGGVVAVAAYRSDGGAYPTWSFVRRLASPGVDRGELNRWAFYAHRVSGAAIFAFLCLHVADVSLYSFSRTLFDDVHRLYGTLPMRAFECALLFAILFHTLNGLRVLAIDLADLGRQAATRALLGVTVVTLCLGVAGSVVILLPGLA
jgi:succinate dehydrogenase / fumarate reductase, cytochrome b subunit